MFRVHFVIDLRLVIAGHFISNIAVVKEKPIFESSLKVHDSNILIGRLHMVLIFGRI